MTSGPLFGSSSQNLFWISYLGSYYITIRSLLGTFKSSGPRDFETSRLRDLGTSEPRHFETSGPRDFVTSGPGDLDI